MNDRTKALSLLGLFTAAVFGLSWLVRPWFETVAIGLVIGMAVPATLFAVIYMFTSPWWTTVIGRAMLISTTALALLVDISLLYYWRGGDVPEPLTLTVYAWIFLGAWWKLGALVVTKWRDFRA